jgi:hypothetical protein
MTNLVLMEIADPAKLQQALRIVAINDKPPVQGVVYTDGEHAYGYLNIDKVLLWRLTPCGHDFEDLRFVLLPLSELHERTVLDMLEEVCRTGGWE